MIENSTEIDFEIIKELWNKYLLEDGSIVRLKNPPIKIFKTDKTDTLGTPIYRVGGITLISSIVPKELKSTPSEDQTLVPADIISELKFSIINEDWCEYKLTDGVIFRLKSVVNKIVKTKKYNQYGEPIYWCTWQVLTDKIMQK